MSQDFQKRLFPLLPKLAEAYGTPVHVYDEIGIRQTLKKMSDLSSENKIVGFKEFFAVKALPVPAILRIIKEYDFGFDCSSIQEVILARLAGAKPDDIMFTSNNTTTKEFESALTNGGCILNLDDISFLDHPIWEDYDFPKTICFRINPGPLRQDESVIGKPEEAKYGIMVSQIEEAYTRAREMGATRFGMHTMICSNDLDYRHMVDTIEMLVEFVVKLKNDTGIQISFINMGGGLGIPYKHGQPEFDLEKLMFWMGTIQHGLPFNLKMYMESGRYVTGPHGVLVNRAINRKDIYQTHIGVQCAMPGLMRPAMYDAYHEISVVDNKGKTTSSLRPTAKVNIVGSICENCDRLATDRMLPEIHCSEIDGDFIVAHDCGAHGAAMGFNYNGRTRPGAVLLTADGSFVEVVRPETADDLLSRTVGL